MICRHYIVYGLSDPTTGELRYIGKSCNGLRRRENHFRYSWRRKKDGAFQYNRAVNEWVRSLGVRPMIEVIETCKDETTLADAEVFWISQFRALGTRLTNHTDGGDGARAGCK